MDWLATLDWTAIGLGAGALAFLLLMGKAVARMRSGRDYEREEPEEPPRTERPTRREKAGAKPPKDESEAGPKKRKKADLAPPAEPLPEAEQAGEPEHERLARGLEKTRGGFIARLGTLFRGRESVDEQLLEQVEEVLFTADIGVKTSQELIDGIRAAARKSRPDDNAVWRYLKDRSSTMIASAGQRTLDPKGSKPFVILVVGVNGTGKTTTIGKLAARFARGGAKVLLAAGDTFRAAAANQLRVWGDRSGVPVVSGREGADPASVVVDALKQAQVDACDIVIADTAGRLHTKSSLMDELAKVKRAIAKQVPGAPHETLLVLDATTGQNAITQAQMFRQATDVTGLILTKLDGTAKGGVLLGICNELQIPVLFIGIGEKVDDLRVFDPEAFVDALYALNPSDDQADDQAAASA
jgi:fused signal recognition particle receptor